ncbi:glutathione S-transferase C-terminal-like protein [Coniophora puteana RWD-64-598 SS2]|uniref:Glutathione S-transferase C-terminal-like protein n=1 Tax=Coniophora puteana (strain RWD-64-598) TaxID=741705 RepID=A0A5M3M850_CONPW|nr:glutathione S-transferase C-terminal-like protein [Coniophora puteana RWD-64-598 SS2]EIW75408.1 glutathione S-transferase C-terminal-like protein [Coniophora puteana RWD-64-598 SS2]
MSERLVFYEASCSAYAQRVRIALHEANAKYTSFEIDTFNKPTWFTEKINPIGKVPAMTYGGPDVPPDQPSPDSVKLAESLIIAEFIADLYPDSGLMPRDPVQRAQVRRFIDVVDTKFAPVIGAWFYQGTPWEGIIEGARALQDLLPDGAAFAVGDRPTLADIAFAPFYSILQVISDGDIYLHEAAKPRDVAEALNSSELARLRKYANGLLARPSFKAAVDQVCNCAQGVFDKKILTSVAGATGEMAQRPSRLGPHK